MAATFVSFCIFTPLKRIVFHRYSRMIIAYLSVATDKQYLETQREAIASFSSGCHMNVDKWIAEVTGRKAKQPAPKLEEVLSRVQRGDTIIVNDISRLSRTLYELMQILSLCLEKGGSLYCLDDRYFFGDKMNAPVMVRTFKLLEEIDHRLVSVRTKDALALMKDSGKRLGRPKGSDSKQSYLDAHKEEVVGMLENGQSVAAICEHFNVSKNTYYKFKRNYGL